ncbi:putative tail assembly protein [Rhizobium phage RHph_X2_30]|nr:putative tail assembly protein [Rhizobium phage RHph_X2_30]
MTAENQQIVVFMRHIRSANLCAGGTRQWFRRQGFDWTDFLNNGIPIEKMEATGDPLALRVTAIARQEVDDV